MNDDQMDELLIQGVRDYNAPREVPRDEMWERIAATRGRRTAEQVRRVTGSRRWLAYAAAAAVILTVGVALGRLSLDRTAPSAPRVASTSPAVPSAPSGDSSAASAAAGAERDTLVEKIHQETVRTGRRVRELASAGPAAASAPTDGRADANRVNQGLAYRLVVLQHLAGSEAMITAFRSGARSGEVDAQLASWSRELLSTTRLLESSVAVNDPVMKRLLGDLDLVISQIVQYTTHGVTNTEELDLIEQTINKRGVMTKLRSTNPGRGVAAGL